MSSGYYCNFWWFPLLIIPFGDVVRCPFRETTKKSTKKRGTRQIAIDGHFMHRTHPQAPNMKTSTNCQKTSLLDSSPCELSESVGVSNVIVINLETLTLFLKVHL